jgi:hypothetical protein
MGWGSVRLWFAAAAAAVLAAACAQTSRVDETLTTSSLTAKSKAVAVMRVGAASPDCINVGVLLGVREGEAFRRHQVLNVVNVRSATEPAVAEVELEPGEYHVVSYRCQTARGIKSVSDSAGGQIYRSSFAHFTLQPGEIVNVGYLQLVAWRRGRNAFGRPVEMDIEVSDWPLAELERFKAKRPQIFAQMKTRLMTVTSHQPVAPTSGDCARLKALQAEGKVQRLPAECAAPAGKRAPAAVAKQSRT